MEEIKLSKETVEALATAITKRFLQGAESLFFGENNSSLGLILKDVKDSILKRQAKEKKEKEREARFEKINKQIIDYNCEPKFGVLMEKPESILKY